MINEDELDLDDIADVDEVLRLYDVPLFRFGSSSEALGLNTGRLYCATCGGFRRMAVKAIYPRKERAIPLVPDLGVDPSGTLEDRHLVPSLLSFKCVQCNAVFTAVIYPGPDGPSLAVLPSRLGGLTTPNTPVAVAYYLDQAYRAEASGARSAAVAMYRSALEHLLFDQGYTEPRMLGPKIAKLRKDIEEGRAPKWAKALEHEYLTAVKDLGDGAMHPNDGEISKQASLDSELLALVKDTFIRLLDSVYEEPRRRSQMLSSLQAKAHTFRSLK